MFGGLAMLEGLHSSSLGQSCAWASPSGTGGAASWMGKAVFGGLELHFHHFCASFVMRAFHSDLFCVM